MMGIDNSYYNRDGKHPVHSATVNSFYMCIHEVTQAEYQAITGTNPSQFKGENRPVEQVSWEDAIEYCNKRSLAEGLTPCYIKEESRYGANINPNANGYRLPTEAEWEYASKGGKNRDSYTYSGSDDINRVTWYKNNSEKMTHDVMTKTPNRLGLYDMSGNVWEWCWNLWSLDIGSSDRVIRSGSWNISADYCTVSYRDARSWFSKYNNLGFRLVRNVD